MFLFNLRKNTVVCGIFQESLAAVFIMGGNFLLFFIMFGKYRLPRKLFWCGHKARNE